MSTTITVPDGRKIEIPTDDLEFAKIAAANWVQKNPLPEIDTTQRAAQLGEEDVSTFGDILKAPVAGVVSAISGALSLPAELIDLATLDEGEESLAEGVRDFFDVITPTTKTGAGNAVKFVTQFVVPGGLAAKAAKAAKLGKVGQVGAFGAADVVATTPDVETLGDFFETGPTQRIKTEDLEGSEKAAADLINRFKVASEGTALLLGGPVLIKGAVKGVGAATEKIARTEAAQSVGQSASAALDGIKSKIFDDVGVKPDLENMNFISRNITKMSRAVKEGISFKGRMPDEVVQQIRHMKIHNVSLANKKARNAVEEMADSLEVLNKNGLLNEFDQQMVLNSINDYLFAVPKGKNAKEAVKLNAENVLKDTDKLFKQIKDTKLSRYGKKSLFGREKDFSLFETAKRLRGDIDDLSKVITDDLTSVAARGLSDADDKLNAALLEKIGKNEGYYGRRIYRAGNDPDFKPFEDMSPSNQKAYQDAVNDIIANSGKEAEELLSQPEAQKQLRDIFENITSFSNANMKPKNMFEEDTLQGASTGVLKERQLDNLPAVRAFLGEYTGQKNIYGPVGRTKEKDGTFKFGKIREQTLDEQKLGLQYKVTETVSKMSNMIQQRKFFNSIKKHNDNLPQDKKFILDQPPSGLEGLNYKPIGSFRKVTNPVTGEVTQVPTYNSYLQYGDLAGKFSKYEDIRALTDIPSYVNFTEKSRLYSTFLGLKGMSQIVKTVYSPITQIRNATTAALFAVRNGNFGNGEDFVNSAKVVFQNINDNISFQNRSQAFKGSGSKVATKQEIKDFYNEMIERGVVNTNAKIGEFEDLLGDAIKGGGFGKKALQIAQNTQNRFAGKLYQGSDDVFKIYSYQMELGRLRKSFENSIKNNQSFSLKTTDAQNILDYGDGFVNLRQLDPEDAAEFLRRESAEIVKETVPNYARVPEFIKQLRQLPVGNFIAFPAEIIRTSGNSYGRAIKELASESDEIRAIGMRRLMGGLTVDATLPAGLYTLGLTLTGSTSEQVDAYKRSFAADWDRYSVMIPMSTDKDGNIRELYNFSYSNPYDYLTRPARALYGAVQNGIRSEKDLTDIFYRASVDSAKEFFSPFMDESIITEKITDLFRNQTRYGRNIWRSADPLGLQISKGFAHLADGITPGGFPIKLRGDVAGQDIQLGSFTLGADFTDFPRAIGLAAGLDPITGVNRRGERIDAAGEFAEALSGLKSVKPRVEIGLMYRGYEASSQVREASGIFNSLAKSKSDMSPEDITKAYIVSNEQRFKALRDLSMAIEDARTLGLSDGEIVTSLKKSKTPNISEMMAGKFTPFYPSSETIKIALSSQNDKVSNPFDFGEMSKIFGEEYGKSFLPRMEEREAEERIRQIREQMSQQVQPEMPTIEIPEISQRPLALNTGASALRQVELDKLLGTD